MAFILTTLVYISATAATLLYAYFWYSYRYWSKRNVPYLEPKMPYGNLRYILCKARGYDLELMDLYNEIKARNLKYAGIWTVANPVFLITDPEYVKKILTKDFGHFVDRGMYYKKSDPLGRSLFLVDETKWRGLRTHLTPTFTSGKMKMMFPLIVEVSNHMTNAIGASINKKEECVDIKEYCVKFTTDVIVSCAFGLDGNSFADPEHSFRNVGKSIFEKPSLVESIRFALMNYAPDLCEVLGVRSYKKEGMEFFYDIIKKTVNYRKDNNVTRNDFLQLVINMMENTKNDANPFTFEDLVANVNLFFIAGFDTSSSAMTFALYELAKRPDLQQKLRIEIESILESNRNELTYDLLHEMKYLQQVIDETLRMYPSVPILQRKCIKNYQFDDKVIIEKGTHVVMPIISIHRDPEFYQDPLVFDPDRFSSENKKNIDNSWYLPFGDGPRNCIGLRFGLMQAKIGLVQILTKYRLKISNRTRLPVDLDERSFLLKTNETIYLECEKL